MPNQNPNQNPNPIAKAVEYDTCVRCHQIFPVDEYFLTPGLRVCKICNTQPASTEQAGPELKKRVAKLAAKQLMAATSRKQIDVPHTSELAEAIMRRVGGVEEFAQQYAEVVEAILAEDKSSRLALSAVEGIAKLIRDSTVMRETAPDVNNLSDAEIEEELQNMLEAKLLRNEIRLELEVDGEDS